jgi:hypothetical protein
VLLVLDREDADLSVVLSFDRSPCIQVEDDGPSDSRRARDDDSNDRDGLGDSRPGTRRRKVEVGNHESSIAQLSDGDLDLRESRKLHTSRARSLLGPTRPRQAIALATFRSRCSRLKEELDPLCP